MIQPSSLHPTTRRWRFQTRSIAYTPGSIIASAQCVPRTERLETEYTADQETHRTPGGAFIEFSYFAHSRHVMTMPI